MVLWYWLFVQASLVRMMSRSYISAMHLFICFVFVFFFLAPLAVGQQAYLMFRCPSCVRPSVGQRVRALTFSLNIFFSETTYQILMKFHSSKCSCHGPLQNFLKEFDSIKNCGCHGNKTKKKKKKKKKLKTLKIFLSETIRVRATKFGM